jgi:endonuclease/exonuclease/phosphatase family metal-dependent hydrolase
MRIASYNVENLFERVAAFSAAGDDETLLQQAEVNELLRKAAYSAADKTRILALLTALGLSGDDEGPLAILRQNRGQLVRRPQNGPPEIVADGRGDWVGWVDLKKEPVDEVATENTARVIHAIDADVIGLVEAETRSSLRDFSRVMLRRVGGEPYAHSMLIQGNDDRGINVGLMTKDGFDLDTVRTHIFDLGANDQPIFSRDCPEYLIRTPGGARILVLVNHFKSKIGGGDARRLAQSTRVRDIVNQRLAEFPRLVVIGDFNDSPDSANLAPLLAGTPLKDVSKSPKFNDGGFPGTFGGQGAGDKIDYMLLSPALFGKVKAAGICRRGVFSASNRWPFFPEIEKKADQASDHAAIWADLNVA